MHCPTHGTTLPASAHDAVDVVCPECRQLWLARGDVYELPPRHEAHEDEDERSIPRSG
jgi:Zn-finger nucleic acid-binding protein